MSQNLCRTHSTAIFSAERTALDNICHQATRKPAYLLLLPSWFKCSLYWSVSIRKFETESFHSTYLVDLIIIIKKWIHWSVAQNAALDLAHNLKGHGSNYGIHFNKSNEINISTPYKISHKTLHTCILWMTSAHCLAFSKRFVLRIIWIFHISVRFMPGGYFAHYLFTLFCMSVERSDTLIRLPVEKYKKKRKARRKNAWHPLLDDVILGSMPKVEICQKKKWVALPGCLFNI